MRPIVWGVTILALLSSSQQTSADQLSYALAFTDNYGNYAFTANVRGVGPTTDPSGTVADAIRLTSGTLHLTSGQYPQLNGDYALYSAGGGNLIYPKDDAIYDVPRDFEEIRNNIIIRSYLDGVGLVFRNSTGTQVSIWASGLGGLAHLPITPGSVWEGMYGYHIGDGNSADPGGGYDMGQVMTLTQVQNTPEPGSLTLMSLGAVALAVFGRRKTACNGSC